MKKTKKKSTGSGGGAKEFLILHCEKIGVGVVAVVALYFAIMGLGYMGTQQVNWQPSELVENANAIRTSINASTRTVTDEVNIDELVDHAATAEQIREPISAAPYRFVVPWNFAPASSQPSTSASSF